MKALMGQIARWLHRPPGEPAPIDHEALRDEMTRSDPAFRHVRAVHHDALDTISAGRGATQLRDRFQEHVQQSWGQDGAR